MNLRRTSNEIAPRHRSTAYQAPTNDVYLSVVSIWEIIIKNKLGRLPLPGTIRDFLKPLKALANIQILDLSESAVLRLPMLPDLHRDPFDRILVCQAIDQGLVLATPDPVLRRYPVNTIW